MKVAFIAKGGAGKSTLAAKLINELGYQTLSFAAPVKKFASEILLRPIDKANPFDRKFLQQLGTDLARARDPQIWVQHFALAYTELLRQNRLLRVQPRIVVDDVRFRNEAEYLRSQGFMLVKVVGRGYEMGSLGLHPSEVELESIIPDFILDNSGSVEDSYELLKGFMVTWLSKQEMKL